NVLCAATWTQVDGWARIEPDNTTANAISADGTTIVGHALDGSGAFRYTQATGFQWLSDALTGQSDSIRFARAVDADGGLILGDTGTNTPAVIWDSLHGARSLADVLRSDYGIDIAEDSLLSPSGISDDGTVMVGQNWIVVLPEPV